MPLLQNAEEQTAWDAQASGFLWGQGKGAG